MSNTKQSVYDGRPCLGNVNDGIKPQSPNPPANKAQGFEANYVFAHESYRQFLLRRPRARALGPSTSPGEGPRQSAQVSCLSVLLCTVGSVNSPDPWQMPAWAPSKDRGWSLQWYLVCTHRKANFKNMMLSIIIFIITKTTEVIK